MMEEIKKRLLQLLPPGTIFADDEIQRLLEVIALALVYLHDKATKLKFESQPSTALDTLTDWQNLIGLPACINNEQLERQQLQEQLSTSLTSNTAKTAVDFANVQAQYPFIVNYFANLSADAINRLNVIYGNVPSTAIEFQFFEGERDIFATCVSACNVVLRESGVPHRDCLINSQLPAHAIVALTNADN